VTNSVPSRLVDWTQFQEELRELGAKLHQERKDHRTALENERMSFVKRVRRWQTFALSCFCFALVVSVSVLAVWADKVNDLERVGYELAHQMRLTQDVVLELDMHRQQLAGDVQRLEWRMDRDGKGM